MYQPYQPQQINKINADYLMLSDGARVTAALLNNLNYMYIQQGNMVIDELAVMQRVLKRLEDLYGHTGIFFGTGEAPDWAYIQIMPVSEVDLNFLAWDVGINSTMYAPHSVCFGLNNTAGHKGFPILSLTLAADSKSASVVLADKNLEERAYDSYAVNDYVQLDIKTHWYNVFIITAVALTEDGDTVLTIAYPTKEVITRLMDLDADTTQNWLWVIGKQVGLPLTCSANIAVFGEGNVAASRGTSVFGRDNLAAGNYSGIVGRGNITGYASFACCQGNTVLGQQAFAANVNNVVSGIYASGFGEKTQVSGKRGFGVGSGCTASGENAFVGGNKSKAQHAGSFVFGNCLTSKAAYQTLFGAFGTATEDMVFAVANGTASKYSLAIASYADGHAEIGLTGTSKKSVVQKQYVDDQIALLKKAIIALGGTIPTT